MAKQNQEAHRLLQRPLYFFDLPTEILLSLRSRQEVEGLHETEKSVPEKENASPLKDDAAPSAASCAMCQVSFSSVVEQREHVRSDFHRYNLKLHLRESPAVDEVSFNRLIGDLDESLSASDSSNSASDIDDPDHHPEKSTLVSLLRRQAKLSQHTNEEPPRLKGNQNTAGSSPVVWLTSTKLPENVSLGVYKALLKRSKPEQDLADTVRQKQLRPAASSQIGLSHIPSPTDAAPRSAHYFLCMLGGGHFAAMIVSSLPQIRKGPGGNEERHPTIKAHKTFHRYTTRRKQGGSQSANDNAKGNAHSAGSSIRRHNEVALQSDIRGVLLEWKDVIDSAELLFIRAAGTTSRRTLYGPYDGQVLTARDPRICSFPFNTRRATQAELLRAFTELTRVKVSTISHAAIVAAETEEKASGTEKPRGPAPTPAPKYSQEEESSLIHTSQIQALIRRTKAQALVAYLKNNNLSPNFTFFPSDTSQNHHAPTALHLAASTNSSALVLTLLTQAGADPTLPNGDGKPAFDIAGDGKTRDAFRIARSNIGESTVAWKAAHVPSPLSEQEARDRQRQEKEIDDAAEAQRRQADLRRIQEEDAALKPDKMERRAGVQNVGTRNKTGAERREEEGRGLSQETRVTLERERRARAAEERIKKTQEGR